MGISRDSAHKRRLTGGKKKAMRKKRKFEMGRQPANTKIGSKHIHLVRSRGGHFKFRALRLETGNFSWGAESVARKTRILGVVYNATSNELVRTNTLVKGAVVQIDATPFRQYYEQHYKTAPAGAKKEEKKDEKTATPAKQSHSLKHKISQRLKARKLDSALEEQFKTGRLYARLSSRPGQSGRADGYILEGEELTFYLRKISEKKKK